MNVLAVLGLFSLFGGHSAPETYDITAPQYWRSAYGSSPWNAMAGDADGDGHADLISIGPNDDSNIDVARTDPLGKPNPSGIAHYSIGKGLVAFAAGSFIRPFPTKDILTIFSDGMVRLASQGIPDGKLYQRIEDVGKIELAEIPQGLIKTAVADFDGDLHSDMLLLGKDGRLLVLYNRPPKQKLPTSEDNPPRFVPVVLKTILSNVRQFAAGKFKDPKGVERGQVVYLDGSGKVWLAAIVNDALAKPRLLTTQSPDDHLVVGRFRSSANSDVLVGQQLYRGGNTNAPITLKGIPNTNAAKSDGVWDVADIDGNGKDDLIRHHEGRERWGAQDIYVHFSYDSSDTGKGYYCSSNDGLLDAWKLGKVKPGGLDLKAMGCQVGHRDIIVAVERFEDVDLAELKRQMDRVSQYFASIPLRNSDGTTGISLHFIYPPPWPNKDHDQIIGKFDSYFPRREHRGVVHAMFAQNGGPLVSAINSDRGRFNGRWQEFIHEFGHQIDLSHDGFYSSPSYNSETGCALYPSVMSYSYSYSLDGSGENVRYSDGARASLVLNELHLSERLPFAIDTVHFLSKGPYHFKIKPSEDGKSSLVDWNWNGLFGEEDVHGDLNYTHGSDPGPMSAVGRTNAGPVAVLHGARPLLVYAQNGALQARVWTGTNPSSDGGRWSEETTDLSAGVTGDPSAAFVNGLTYVTYPTEKGIVLRAISVDAAGHLQLQAPNLLPRDLSGQPTLVAVENRLALLVWHSKNQSVDLTFIKTVGVGLSVGATRRLDFASENPVGVVTGATGSEGTDLWIGRIQADGPDHGGQTEIVRYRVSDTGERLVSRQWVAGVYARRRMTLLWAQEAGSFPDGRLYLIGSGAAPGGENKEQYITMSVPYKDMGGWLIRRYEQPNFVSPSPAGACFFQGNILYALRFSDDNLNVSFFGNGCTPWPTGDFDDIGHIRDFGLSRSIREMPR